MSIRSRYIIVLSLTLVVLVTGGFACKRKEATNTAENANTAVNVNLANTNVATNVNAAPADPTAQTKQELGQIAMSFAERFGSYSNQNNFENIVDLKPFMSKRMQAWADQYVASGRAKSADTSIYYGVTTRALSSEVTQFNANGPVEFTITTQRREATGTTSNAKVSNQDLTIVFVREDGVWRVDEARWK